MKTIFRLLSLGVLAAAFVVVGSTAAFAQDPCADTEAQTKLQDEIRAKYNSKEIQLRKEAVAAGKQLLEKYGTCQFPAEFVEWLKPKIGPWEKRIKEMEDAFARSAVLKRFDAAVPAKNWDEAYAAGNEFVSKYPDDPAQLNVIIPLGFAGLIESSSSAKNYKYNNDTIKYAKMAIGKLKGGAKATKKTPKGEDAFGAFQFECTRDECISGLTYSLAYITYHAQGNKQAALPYFYEVTKIPGSNKDNPDVYVAFGAYYYETVKKLVDEVKAMIVDQKDTDPEDVKSKKETDIKAKIATLNGYSERSMDAYSRAYKLIKDEPATKTFKDGIYKTIQSLYNVRFAKQEGVDQWISATVTKPLPDPTSKVDPISDPEPTTTTTTTSTAPATTKPTPTPASTTPTKPASTTSPKPNGTVKGNGATSKAPSESTTAVKPKAAVAKPATVKKKGTR